MKVTIDKEKLTLKGQKYAHNNQVALQLFTQEREPYGVCTTCMDVKLEPDETVIDSNNFPTALQELIEAGIVEPTGEVVPSGFCTYPVVKILKEQLL